MPRAARRLAVTPAVRLVALLAVLAAASPACSGHGEIVIGVVGPLSGPLAFVGEAQRRGAEIAAEEINGAGGVGGRRIKIVARADADFAGIVGDLRDLVSVDRVAAIIGPETPEPLLGVNAPTARAGIPVLLPSAPLGEVGPPAASNVFRLAPSYADQAAVLSGWLVAQRKLRRVAVAAAADSAGRGGRDLLAKAVAASGGSIVGARDFVAGDLDQTGVARALRGSRADALVIWGTPADSARVAAAVRRIGWDVQIAGPADLFVSDYRSIAGTASEDTALVLPFRRDWFSPRIVSWLLGYAGRFGIVTLPKQRTLIPDLPLLAMSSYDAVTLVAEAVRRAGTNPRGMVRALESLNGFQGIATSYTFGPRDHEAYAPADLWMARFSNFAVVYDVDPRANRDEQIAFYKCQVSACYVPEEFFRTQVGSELRQRILEDVLTNPETIDFFREYRAPRPPPGPIR